MICYARYAHVLSSCRACFIDFGTRCNIIVKAIIVLALLCIASKVGLVYTFVSKRGIERTELQFIAPVCCVSCGYVRFQVHVMLPVKKISEEVEKLVKRLLY